MKRFVFAASCCAALMTSCVGLTEMTTVSSYTTITAHSGAYRTEANSLHFIETALRNNAEIIEFDVNMRPNGTLVMYHNEVPDDISGVEIEQALRLIRNTRAQINLDIKTTRTLRQLRQMVLRNSMLHQVFLTGIEEKDVEAVRREFPEVKYYLNYQPDTRRFHDSRYLMSILDILRRTGAIGINCHYSNANQTLATLLHRNGYKLSVWTVDKRSKMRDAAGYRPDNITSRRPDAVRKIVHKGHW